ncbi:MAG: hypothetical protein LN414_00300, partial [Candidatus Thermoplasmatota archaeon]|nr:hypothetical protein [Candidatus Thermoplasmatota archaeon]
EGEAGAYAASTEEDTLGGAGGGGRSAGGGGGRSMGNAEDGVPGAGATVLDGVGQGGDSRTWITSNYPTVSADSAIVSRPGNGGEPLEQIPGDPLEGYSVSGDGTPGSKAIHIPMSHTILSLPLHETSIYQMPMFTWVDVHSSTEDGNVTSYILVIDDDEDFTDPDKVIEVWSNSALVSRVPFGVHYWYVRAIYTDVGQTFGPPSAIHWFSFYNAPPRFQIIEPEAAKERQATPIDMSKYISDPDTPVENLTLYSADERVVGIDGLTMTYLFPEPSPMEWVRFSVFDGHSTKWFNMPIRVIDVNDPPVIISIGGYDVPVTVVVDEGEIIWLEIVAEDRDGEDLKYTLLTSWQDMRLESSNTIRIWTRRGMLGDRTAKLLVEDERGEITSTRLTIRVRNTPDPPSEIVVFGPKDRSSHLELDPISFTVKVTDPDLVWGGSVNVSWESSISGHLMTRRTSDVATFTTNSLPIGAHVITITVDDGTFVEQTSLHITVTKRPMPYYVEEPEEEGSPPLAILMLILMPVLGYYLGRRGVGYARE